MAEVKVETIVDAPVKDVWESWDRFGDIDAFHPQLKASFLLENSATTGLGARRQCDLADGKNHIREEIIGYTPEEEMIIDIYEGTMPLRKAEATLRFEAVTHGKTRLSMKMEFEPKMGLIGKMMIPMMKMQFGKMLLSMLRANAGYVEKGLQTQVAA
jgi:ribosome-associated toxin RatA of RatAB toxin-antitoxin module